MGKGFIYYKRDEVGEAELARHKEAAQEAWQYISGRSKFRSMGPHHYG